MSTQFTATSLADIAEHFESQGRKAFNSQTSAYTLRASARHAGECWVWEQAAKMLRETKLVVPERRVAFILPTGEKVAREVLAQWHHAASDFAVVQYAGRFLLLFIGAGGLGEIIGGQS